MKEKSVLLVVDDQPQNNEVLEAYLVPKGYDIVTAANGEEALLKLQRKQIDLVLLDIIMPGMDGFEVTRRIRKLNTLPIILVTALRDTEDRVKGIEAGCDDFISKPVDKMELLARVRSLLRIKAYNDLINNYLKDLEATKISADAAREYAESIVNTVREPLIALDQNLRVVSVSRSFYEFFKVKPEETIGRLIYELGNKQWDIPKLRELLEKILPNNTTFNDFEIEHNFTTIGKRSMLLNARKIKNALGNDKTILLAIEDVTERKLAEQIIALEKDRLAVTLRSIGDGVITTDTLGKVVFMNKVAEELCGCKLAQALGKPLISVFTIINETTRLPHYNPAEKVLASGEIVEPENHTLLISRDSTERIIANSGAPIKDKDNKTIGVVLVFRDMTEKQKLSDTMQRALKLESLGVLAGGIAHDFNNLMGGIFGYIDLANLESDRNKASNYLSIATNTIGRARALTGKLLTFTKTGAPIQNIGNLFPFVQETAQLALSGANVSCHFDVSPELWACNFDRNQIGQVIENLIINAQQAIPEGGTIELTARNIRLNEHEHQILRPHESLQGPLVEGREAGNYVRISIKDSGIGIPKDLISKIFDPFFTTKPKMHGLGLATCFSIVNRHEGCIEVESEMGKGSIFHVYLPAVGH